MSPFSQRILSIIAAVPVGQVATYGQIAVMAGEPRAARQVSRLLHSCSDKYNLPWHRIINAQGRIVLNGLSARKQTQKLRAEGIEISDRHRIDLTVYQWQPKRDD
ncbi:6-O-methylguanine DNA methyltransferase [Marinicella pacifica]|uniref:6-O-methylguanine DNA methyltransferase n=1 Tax=Marinicella pacifica TaxID=1171543 RepID=A0A917CM56_9GAMM|nr:MGMT family protein [Marinicella pacifica]GGF90772.1 6-O-methylguanine DNA methyltransferase [Marinicella pacifica]